VLIGLSANIVRLHNPYLVVKDLTDNGTVSYCRKTCLQISGIFGQQSLINALSTPNKMLQRRIVRVYAKLPLGSVPASACERGDCVGNRQQDKSANISTNPGSHHAQHRHLYCLRLPQTTCGRSGDSSRSPGTCSSCAKPAAAPSKAGGPAGTCAAEASRGDGCLATSVRSAGGDGAPVAVAAGGEGPRGGVGRGREVPGVGAPAGGGGAGGDWGLPAAGAGAAGGCAGAACWMGVYT